MRMTLAETVEADQLQRFFRLGAAVFLRDAAHQPDLDYVAYLMTGDRYYLDQLNAQAAYDIITTGPNGRHYGAGIVADGADQVRAQGWSLREIVEVAAANPNGSAEKVYFTNIMIANFTFLLSETTAANQGQATGWIPGNANGSGEIAPWQQDYFATTVVLAAEQGVAAATQLLLWETNFLAGRFLAAVLQRVEREVGDARDFHPRNIRRIDAENSALVARSITMIERSRHRCLTPPSG